jgi:hypothetical protein
MATARTCNGLPGFEGRGAFCWHTTPWTFRVNRSVWDSNSPIDPNVLTGLALDDATHGTRSRVRRARPTWNWQLIDVKELGVAKWIWLGVRDDFRNRLITAA